MLKDDAPMLNYVNAMLNGHSAGGFLHHFFQACINADADNYAKLKPVLEELSRKYPARPEYLAAEESFNPSIKEEEGA